MHHVLTVLLLLLPRHLFLCGDLGFSLQFFDRIRSLAIVDSLFIVCNFLHSSRRWCWCCCSRGSFRLLGFRLHRLLHLRCFLLRRYLLGFHRFLRSGFSLVLHGGLWSPSLRSTLHGSL